MRIVLLLAATCLLVASEPTVSAVQAAPEGTFAVAIIPDLRASLGRIEQASLALSPDAPPGQLMTQVGTMLGDPGLERLGAGACLIAVGPGGAAPSLALIIPSEDAAAYAAAAQGRGMKTEAIGSLVVMGRKAGDLALGKAVATEHAALTATSVARDMRVLIAPQRIITAYQPMLAGFTTMMTAQLAKQPNGAVAAKIVGIEVAGMLAALQDVDAMQLDLGLTGTVIVVDQVLQAKAESGLAKAFVAPPSADTRAVATRMGLEPGYLVAIGRYHPQGTSAWLAELLASLREQPAGQDLIDDGMIAMVREWGEAVDGAFAVRMRAVGDHPMRMDGVNGARDGARVLALTKRMFSGLFSDGAMAELYRGMGIGMTFSDQARLVGTIPVAKAAYTLDASKLPADQQASMRTMMQDVEIAALPDSMLYSTVPADLDRLLVGGWQPLPTAAEHVIGGGRDGYLDLDWLGMMKATMRANAAALPAMAAALAKLPPGEPMTAAWTVRDGRLLGELRLPMKPFADFSKAMQESVMGGMDGAAPQPEPQAGDEPIF